MSIFLCALLEKAKNMRRKVGKCLLENVISSLLSIVEVVYLYVVSTHSQDSDMKERERTFLRQRFYVYF